MTVYSLNTCVFVCGSGVPFQVLLSVSKNGTKRSTYLNDIGFHNCVLVERFGGVGCGGCRKRKREGYKRESKDREWPTPASRP